MNKSICFALAAAVTVGAAGVAAPTAGYAAIPVVTTVARKRSESVQDVPISIEVLTAQDLQRRSIVNIADVAVSTPGLSIEQQGAGGFITPVIRGMAQNNISTDLSYDNNVGIFMNGVYQSGRNSIDMELVGIERVEVARGPQSALYGRSTFAGAINYIYADPTDDFQADLSTTVGSDEDYGATFDISGPIDDMVKGRLSAGYRDFDGTFSNKAGGDNLQGYESKAVAGALIFDLSEAVTATLNLLYSDRTNDQDAQFLVGLNCGAVTPTYYCGELDAPGAVDISGVGFADNEVNQYSLKLDWDAGDFTITSLTAFTDTEYDTLLDRDYGSEELGTGLSLDVCSLLGGCFMMPPTVIRTDTGIQSYAHSSSETDDFSQEFRITSANDEGLTWMAGVFYYQSDTMTNTAASLGGANLGPTESYTGFFAPPFTVADPINQSAPFNIFETDTEAWAVFGQVGYDLSDTLSLTGELRYTDEEKKTHIMWNIFPTDETYERDFDYYTPRLTLSFTPEDDQLIYASLAKGVRTGGINGSVCTPSMFAPACDMARQEVERFFEEEENWTFEIGSKYTLMDNKLQLNTALYYTEWEDLQLPALNADLTLGRTSLTLTAVLISGVWKLTVPS